MHAYPARESDALPDVEVFCDFAYVCKDCGDVAPSYRDYYGIAETTCDKCNGLRVPNFDAGQYWYWPCFPGCLPDSDPIGPFNTEAEALADVQKQTISHKVAKLGHSLVWSAPYHGESKSIVYGVCEHCESKVSISSPADHVAYDIDLQGRCIPNV